MKCPRCGEEMTLYANPGLEPRMHHCNKCNVYHVKANPSKFFIPLDGQPPIKTKVTPGEDQ